MNTVAPNEYDGFAANYHWLYSDRILSGEPFLEDCAQILDALSPKAKILDCACGIGIHTLALARRGYPITYYLFRHEDLLHSLEEAGFQTIQSDFDEAKDSYSIIVRIRGAEKGDRHN